MPRIYDEIGLDKFQGKNGGCTSLSIFHLINKSLLPQFISIKENLNAIIESGMTLS